MTSDIIKDKQKQILQALKDKAKLYQRGRWISDYTLAEKVGLFPEEVRGLLKRKDFPERIFIAEQKTLQATRYRYKAAV